MPMIAQLEAVQALTDAELLSAHVNGDPDAFSILINRHYDYLWRIALRTSFSPEDAADALQDALLSACRQAHRFRGDCPFRGWLYRIVVNSCLDQMRSVRRQRTVALTEKMHESYAKRVEQAPSPVDGIVVAQALTKLPPEQRAAVVIVDMLGYSTADASAVLAVPVGTVKSRCSRARTKLASLLLDFRVAG